MWLWYFILKIFHHVSTCTSHQWSQFNFFRNVIFYRKEREGSQNNKTRVSLNNVHIIIIFPTYTRHGVNLILSVCIINICTWYNLYTASYTYTLFLLLVVIIMFKFRVNVSTFEIITQRIFVSYKTICTSISIPPSSCQQVAFKCMNHVGTYILIIYFHSFLNREASPIME